LKTQTETRSLLIPLLCQAQAPFALLWHLCQFAEFELVLEAIGKLNDSKRQQ
jgi:hypothetical protein